MSEGLGFCEVMSQSVSTMFDLTGAADNTCAVVGVLVIHASQKALFKGWLGLSKMNAVGRGAT